MVRSSWHPRPLRLQPLDVGLDRGRTGAEQSTHETIVIKVKILPHARGVVHQADQPHQRVVGDRRQAVLHVFRRQLAAQMEEVLRLQLGRQRRDVGDALGRGLLAGDIEAEVAEAQRVQHRGDAGRGALRVVGNQRRTRGKTRLRPRLDLALEIVGVQVDQAGQQIIAGAIDRCGRSRRRVVDRRDDAAPGADTAVNDLIGQNQPRVGEDQVLHMAKASRVHRG